MRAARGTRRVLLTAVILIVMSVIWLGAVALFLNIDRTRPETPEVVIVDALQEEMIVQTQENNRVELEIETNLVQAGNLTVDVGPLKNGYFRAKSDPGSRRFKLRVIKENSVYTYDLNNKGEYETFPLQMGSGRYTCLLYENIWGSKYSKEAEMILEVGLRSEDEPFLHPNQYVNYDENSYAVREAVELCEGFETDEEKLNVLCSFIRENFTYDTQRARSNPGFYYGDAEACFVNRSGLCQDFAVMLASMLRVQGIPAQLVLGYADGAYHAWNMVLIDGEYRLVDITAELNGFNQFSNYKAERYY